MTTFINLLNKIYNVYYIPLGMKSDDIKSDVLLEVCISKGEQ